MSGQHLFRKCFRVLCFILSILLMSPPPYVLAQAFPVSSLHLPVPGTVIDVSAHYTPLLIKGLTVDRTDPYKFKFLMDTGDSALEGEALETEVQKMIRYFTASLTTQESDMWVNLSPAEKDRIIPDNFGRTEMGRDLLAQDYILKQLTATLMSPENEAGKRFWEKVYEEIYEDYNSSQPLIYTKRGSAEFQGDNPPSFSNPLSGTSEGAEQTGAVPVSQGTVPFDSVIESFNKVWIVPETGYFYEHNNTVFIADAKLKVMMESDYLAMVTGNRQSVTGKNDTDMRAGYPLPVTGYQDDIKSIIRSEIIPIIEDEINNGANFAGLRQIYSAMLLSLWFKRRLKEHMLAQVYADSNGHDAPRSAGDVPPEAIEHIWSAYVDSFRKGIAGTIREEYDPQTSQIVARSYFTGGAVAPESLENGALPAMLVLERMKNPLGVDADFNSQRNLAMLENRQAVAEKWRSLYQGEVQVGARYPVMANAQERVLLDELDARQKFIESLPSEELEWLAADAKASDKLFLDNVWALMEIRLEEKIGWSREREVKEENAQFNIFESRLSEAEMLILLYVTDEEFTAEFVKESLRVISAEKKAGPVL